MAANETRLTTTPAPAVTAVTAAPPTLQAIVAQRRLEARARRRRALDYLLAGLVVVFAVMLASTALRNSDFLLHAATGRLIAHGEYAFGVDPFAHTTQGEVWVNHAWLFDLGAYFVYQAAGGAGVVVVKAVGAALLAALLLRISRLGESLWWPVVTTALALLCVAPRLLLVQPTLVSFLLLPATLGVLLWRSGLLARATTSGATVPSGPVPLWHYWPVWPLFVLWVNCDEWFVLGPVVVGLFALGRWLQTVLGKEAVRPGELRALAVAFGVGVAVCFLNPHHGRAFLIPSTLGWFDTAGRGDLERDVLYQGLYYSPLDLKGEYYKPTFGLSVAGLAIFPMAAVGLLSFIFNLVATRRVNYWRILLWLAFLFLGLASARAIPFFGLVAGPITALNFQEHALATWSDSTKLPIPLRRWLVAGRVVSVMGLLVLLALAWPGWLHAEPYYTKRVAVAEDFDPAAEQSARAMRRLHEEGVLGAEPRGFNYSPEIANYFAWYCPEEKAFFDNRYYLEAGAAKDFVDVRRGLREVPDTSFGEEGELRQRTKTDWARPLQRRKITHVILTAPNPEALRLQIMKLAAEPRTWTLVHFDAHSAVYVSNERCPKAGRARYRGEEEVFNPAPGRRLDPDPPPSYPEKATPWDEFTEPQGRRDLNTDEANMLLALYWGESFALPREREDAWQHALAAGLVAGAAQGPAPLAPVLVLHGMDSFKARIRAERAKPPQEQKGVNPTPVERAALSSLEQFVRLSDRGSEWYPLLAARAARRGIAATPRDANAYMALAEAYIRISGRGRDNSFLDQIAPRTREWTFQMDRTSTPAYSADARLLGQVRDVQILVALNQALALNPDLEEAHSELAYQYMQRNYLDLALKHAKEEVRLTRQKGPRQGEKRNGKDGSFDLRLAQAEKELEQLKSIVDKAQDQYELQSSTFKDDQQRAQRAFTLGLAEMALKILNTSDAENVKKFGLVEADIMLRLLLDTGQVKDLVEGFDKNFEKVLGKQAYQRYRALIAVARGNYKEADKALKTYGELLRDTVKELPPESPDLLPEQKAFGNVYDPLTVALDTVRPKQEIDALVNVPGGMWGATIVDPGKSKQKLESRPYVAATVGQLVIDLNPQFGSPLWIYLNSVRVRARLGTVEVICGVLRNHAEVFVVRGLLEMEVGNTKAAEERFREALQTWNTGWDGDPTREDWNNTWEEGGHHMHFYAADFLRHLYRWRK